MHERCLQDATAAGSSAAHRRRSSCRGCGGDGLVFFLSLGPQPLANAFLDGPEEFERERFYPLDVCFCRDCSLVQLLDVVDPEVLFHDYIYVTGISSTVERHNRQLAETVVSVAGLEAGSFVVEVASNDGSLLRQFDPYGVRTLGIEPASNIAERARESGVETLSRFFDSEVAREVREARGPARAVLANNVLAHVDDPIDFLAGCRELLDEEGTVVVEVPYVLELLDRLEYDTMYHEHLSYFSVTALRRIFSEAGLALRRVDRIPLHGGSLRLYGRRSGPEGHGAVVDAMVRREEEAGLHTVGRYERFASDVHTSREALVDRLEEHAARGETLAAYGAPAKGNTLLNFCGIGTDLLPYTVDRNPLKVGTFTPGRHLPVLPVETLAERAPDITLILAWNFAEEIIRQQRAYTEGGGRFLVPIPAPRMVAK